MENGYSAATTMGVFAALAYDIIAAVNSSPQTTEINAAKRAPTLMKWVNLGVAQVAIFTLLGVGMEAARGNPVWPVIAGGGGGGALLYVQYIHACKSGLASEEEGTEDY